MAGNPITQGHWLARKETRKNLESTKWALDLLAHMLAKRSFLPWHVSQCDTGLGVEEGIVTKKERKFTLFLVSQQ